MPDVHGVQQERRSPVNLKYSNGVGQGETDVGGLIVALLKP